MIHMSGNCPRCGAPLTPSGNCSQLCGGAYTECRKSYRYAYRAPVAVLERAPVDPRDLSPVPTDVLTAWVDWKALERSLSTPGPVYCYNCGAANPAGATYCQACGKMLNP